MRSPDEELAPSLEGLEVRDTPFARLHLGAREVLKRRRAVHVVVGDEEMDLTSASARRAACLEELALDRELAPGVARDVVPLVRDEAGGLRIGDPANAVDWALRLARLPDSDRAADRLEAGRLSEQAIEAIARHLARSHERARGAAVDPGAIPDRLRSWIRMRIESPDARRGEPLPEEAARAEAWQLAFLERASERLVRRAASEHVRMGHGELTLDHVFVDEAGGVAVLAGLGVGPRARDVDVAADVALFATDLAQRGRADLAERFVAEYARLANDFDLYPLLDFHASLRASIRAKLDWLGADLAVAGSATERRCRERARRFLALALAQPRRPLLPPSVVAMGGQVASGKSTVARHVARRIGAPVVGSDPTRDDLIGARLNEELHEARWERSCAPGFGERVYEEVLRRAAQVLETGRPVVVDGCFRSRAQRARARALAARFGLPFLFVEAQVSREVQRERLGERALRDGVTIDEWVEIADEMRAQWEPADDLPGSEYLALDTSRPIEGNAAAIEDRLATWPAGFTG